MQKVTGQDLVIINRSGGAGATVWASINEPPADGYHLSLISLPQVILQPGLTPGVGYKFIDRACRQYGFFYVCGHGIDPDLIDEVWRLTRNFFDLPDAARQRLSIHNSAAGRGYEGVGAQTLGAAGGSDFKESFYLGLDPEPPFDLQTPTLGKGFNQWSDEIPEFKPMMQRYLDAMHTLANRLMNGIGSALDLPPGYTVCYRPAISPGHAPEHHRPQSSFRHRAE